MKLKVAMMAALLLSQAVSAAPKALTFKNQRGSVLELNILADNKIEGTFTTAVASKGCPQAVGKSRPIIGYLVGNAVSFSVVYPMCGSILSVTGNFDAKQTLIDTMSLLEHQATDIEHEGPGARFIGHDTYRKV